MRFTTSDNLIHALSTFKEKLDSTYAAKTHGTHLTLGTTSSTAYRGDLGNVAYVHSQAAHAPSNAQKNSDITKAEIEAKLTGAITSHTHSYLPLAGGTLTGNVTIKHGTENEEAQYVAKRTDTGVGVYMGVGSGGTNHGVYSQTLNKWMVYADATKVYLQGNADTATKLATTRTIKIGNKSLNFDGSAAITYTLDDIGAAPSSHNHTQLTGEVRFPGSGTYSDPWSGTTCAIKVTGNIGCSGGLRANGGIATCGTSNGVATTDGSTYVANLRYAQSKGICDLGSNSVPGRLYIRSGQGTAGSGVYVETKVTDGNAYMQYLSSEAGTIALTSHLSDRTRKDNIVYTNDEKSNFSNNDFYNFIKDDLDLATYTLKENYAATDTHTKLNFIAQDILWDFNRNEENKVGNLIVQAEAAMESQYSLKYDADNFIAVIAGALKEAINEIELLKSKNEELIERLLEIELNEGGK